MSAGGPPGEELVKNTGKQGILRRGGHFYFIWGHRDRTRARSLGSGKEKRFRKLPRRIRVEGRNRASALPTVKGMPAKSWAGRVGKIVTLIWARGEEERKSIKPAVFVNRGSRSKTKHWEFALFVRGIAVGGGISE